MHNDLLDLYSRASEWNDAVESAEILFGLTLDDMTPDQVMAAVAAAFDARFGIEAQRELDLRDASEELAAAKDALTAAFTALKAADTALDQAVSSWRSSVEALDRWVAQWRAEQSVSMAADIAAVKAFQKSTRPRRPASSRRRNATALRPR